MCGSYSNGRRELLVRKYEKYKNMSKLKYRTRNLGVKEMRAETGNLVGATQGGALFILSNGWMFIPKVVGDTQG